MAAILAGSLRIAATYTVFSHTFDELAHIACGMEMLDRGVYRYEAQHPPLARVAAAVGPYLLGIRSQGTPNDNPLAMHHEGLAILDRGGDYDRALSMARLGILPFFWGAVLSVYWLGRRLLDPAAAALAAALFSFLPPVLAHAGVATTDMALTAFLAASFAAAIAWAAGPSPTRALAFGACAALAVLSKLSALVFLPVAILAALAWQCFADRPSPREAGAWIGKRVPTLALALTAGCLILWGGYRFSFGHVPAAGMRLPAPEFFAGIAEVRKHNAEGHPSFLLGRISLTGFWLFYPVALAVKTPLAFLALLLPALAHPEWRRRLRPALAFAAAILAIGLSARINIGIRHILPIYAGLALVAAGGAIRLFEEGVTRRWMRPALAVLLLWFAGSSAASHPDYLPYFNELAGGSPEKILVDSDLDWGQDLKRLSRRLRQVGARWVSIQGLSIVDLDKLGFPLATTYTYAAPNPGWNAVPFTYWKQRRLGLITTHPEIPIWADRVPPGERVGRSIMLWYFPPRPGAR